MKIKTVAVLGAGAVGSYVIWGLSRRKDILEYLEEDSHIPVWNISNRRT